MNQAKLYLITEENKNCFSSMEIQNLKSSVLLYPSFSLSFLSKQTKNHYRKQKKKRIKTDPGN